MGLANTIKLPHLHLHSTEMQFEWKRKVACSSYIYTCILVSDSHGREIDAYLYFVCFIYIKCLHPEVELETHECMYIYTRH